MAVSAARRSRAGRGSAAVMQRTIVEASTVVETHVGVEDGHDLAT
jgi:hypothetical protein